MLAAMQLMARSARLGMATLQIDGKPSALPTTNRSVSTWHRAGLRITRPDDRASRLREYISIRWPAWTVVPALNRLRCLPIAYQLDFRQTAVLRINAS